MPLFCYYRYMNTWHRLTNINLETRKAFCSSCQAIVGIIYRNRTASGKINWRCGVYENKRKSKDKYRHHKKDKCERCGFVPEHLCQLDVDHIDNNHKNNDLANLMTLCANCHRLKSLQARI